MDDISELALKIMDTVAYGGPYIEVTAMDVEALSTYERTVLERAVAKALTKGTIEVEYDYNTYTLMIKPKLTLST